MVSSMQNPSISTRTSGCLLILTVQQCGSEIPIWWLMPLMWIPCTSSINTKDKYQITGIGIFLWDEDFVRSSCGLSCDFMVKLASGTIFASI
jgi:hypothetical protein